MWYKPIVITVLFYLFAIMQNSFFAHFSLFGTVPNLVFIFFFTLIFFIGKNNYFQIIFIAIIAGLLLDIFSNMHFGTSIILLLVIGLAFKKIQSILQVKKSNDFPFVYFLALFSAMLIIYDLALFRASFNLIFLAEIAYNIIFATFAFHAYKKLLQPGADGRQLRLFN